jgi:hypothetical protein
MIYVSTGLLTHSEVTIASGDNQLAVLDSGLGFAELPDKMAIDRLAQFAYYSYGAQTGWKNYQGLPMPKWADLPSNIRAAWRNSTKTVLCASGTLDGIASNAKNIKPVVLPKGDSGSITSFEPVLDLEE